MRVHLSSSQQQQACCCPPSSALAIAVAPQCCPSTCCHPQADHAAPFHPPAPPLLTTKGSDSANRISGISCPLRRTARTINRKGGARPVSSASLLSVTLRSGSIAWPCCPGQRHNAGRCKGSRQAGVMQEEGAMQEEQCRWRRRGPGQRAGGPERQQQRGTRRQPDHQHCTAAGLILPVSLPFSLPPVGGAHEASPAPQQSATHNHGHQHSLVVRVGPAAAMGEERLALHSSGRGQTERSSWHWSPPKAQEPAISGAGRRTRRRHRRRDTATDTKDCVRFVSPTLPSPACSAGAGTPPQHRRAPPRAQTAGHR